MRIHGNDAGNKKVKNKLTANKLQNKDKIVCVSN